jgi:hypothetical protein
LQVSLPHYKDAQFLARGELRYKRFLFMHQQRHLLTNSACAEASSAPSELLLVPCYDMALIWHTHMLHPLAYKIDTETVLGFTLPHRSVQ